MVYKFDINCLSETELDSSTRPDDDNLETTGYDIARADHPSNTKRGGVCIYYKECLPLRVLNIVFLNEVQIMNWGLGARHVILLFSANEQVSRKTFLKAFVKILKEP